MAYAPSQVASHDSQCLLAAHCHSILRRKVDVSYNFPQRGVKWTKQFRKSITRAAVGSKKGGTVGPGGSADPLRNGPRGQRVGQLSLSNKTALFVSLLNIIVRKQKINSDNDLKQLLSKATPDTSIKRCIIYKLLKLYR